MKRLMVLCIFILPGCTKTSDELLSGFCIDGLKHSLEHHAKYDGWSVKDARIVSIRMTPHEKQDVFMNAEVVIDSITVKNGFNADVKSVAVCTAIVVPSSEERSEYLPLYYEHLGKEHAISSLRFSLNGEPLGFHDDFEIPKSRSQTE